MKLAVRYQFDSTQVLLIYSKKEAARPHHFTKTFIMIYFLKNGLLF